MGGGGGEIVDFHNYYNSGGWGSNKLHIYSTTHYVFPEKENSIDVSVGSLDRFIIY